MTTTGIATIDETVQHTMRWVNEVCQEMGDPLRMHGWAALRGVLQHLRDVVGDDEGAHLAAQLPLLIRGLFYEGYDPNPIVEPERDLETFLRTVEEGMGTDRIDAENATRAVFAVISRHVGGEADQIRRRLSAPVRSLWPEGAAAAPKPTRARSSARPSSGTTPRPPRPRPRTRPLR